MGKDGRKVIITTTKFVKKLKKSDATTINTVREYVEPEPHGVNYLIKGIVTVLVLIAMVALVVSGILIEMGVLK